MLNLAWGGYRNGYIPDAAMSPIDSQGHRLESTAAAEFLAMQAAMLRDLGRTISVAPGDDSAFRTIAQQQVDYNLYLQGGNVASAPGLSNHGWGRAVDITGYEVHDDVWAWLLAHAGEYGYSHATGALSGERWHWESTSTPGTTTASAGSTPLPTTYVEEDEMKVWKLGNSYIIVDHVDKKYRVLDNPVATEWNGFKNSEDKGAYFVPIDQNGWADLSKGFTRVW
jgi:hypothetical protein